MELTPAHCGDTKSTSNVDHQNIWTPKLDSIDGVRGEYFFDLKLRIFLDLIFKNLSEDGKVKGVR